VLIERNLAHRSDRFYGRTRSNRPVNLPVAGAADWQYVSVLIEEIHPHSLAGRPLERAA